MILLNWQKIFSQLNSEQCNQLKRHRLDAEVGSTNEIAMESFSKNDDIPAVCLAEAQTSGRGRNGRHWVSPQSQNIYMSVVWRFNNGMDTLPALSLAVGVVVADIIKNYGIDVDLKWPNDVLVKGKKIAGVLIESRIKPNGSIDAVIGVGVNVAMGVKDSVMIDQPWSDLDTEKTIKEELDRSQIAGKLLSAIMSLCSNYEQKGFDEYRPRWLEYDICSGREVQILENDMTYYGDCVGIDETGALKVVVDGVEKLLYAADVSVRVSA